MINNTQKIFTQQLIYTYTASPIITSASTRNKRVITDRCSKSLTRPLSQVFTYLNKCPTYCHLVWDIKSGYLVLWL